MEPVLEWALRLRESIQARLSTIMRMVRTITTQAKDKSLLPVLPGSKMDNAMPILGLKAIAQVRASSTPISKS